MSKARLLLYSTTLPCWWLIHCFSIKCEQPILNMCSWHYCSLNCHQTVICIQSVSRISDVLTQDLLICIMWPYQTDKKENQQGEGARQTLCCSLMCSAWRWLCALANLQRTSEHWPAGGDTTSQRSLGSATCLQIKFRFLTRSKPVLLCLYNLLLKCNENADPLAVLVHKWTCMAPLVW